MVKPKKITKKKLKYQKFTLLLTYLYIFIYPLGQLLRIEKNIYGSYVVIHPLEIIAIALTALAFINIKDLGLKIGSYITFLIALLFSMIISFGSKELVFSKTGIFYLIRYLSFVGVFYGAYVFAYYYGRQKLEKVLLFLGLALLMFGWVQYLYYPNLKVLKYLGWDDHIYRLSGTFLDPGFTGIILSIISIYAIYQFIGTKKIVYFFTSISLVFSVFFTYSRSSYLAFFSGIITLIILSKHSIKRLVIFGLPIVTLTILLLPRPGGEGIRLERTASVYARMENYREVIMIWETSPLFGIGFNNLCAYRLQKSPGAEATSHACSGADSSILMILATSGFIGLITFSRMIFKNLKLFWKLEKSSLIYSSAMSIFVHSLFTNSIFYPWVVGWLAFCISYVLEKKELRTVIDGQ